MNRICRGARESELRISRDTGDKYPGQGLSPMGGRPRGNVVPGKVRARRKIFSRALTATCPE